MYEARVELLVRIQVPERLQPVAVVQVRVAAHHLPVYAADVGLKVLRKAGCLAEPVPAREHAQRRVQRGRAGWNGRRGATGCGGGVARYCGGGGGCGRGRSGVRGRVGGEERGVADLAEDPLLDQVDVLEGGDADRLLVAVEPGVCVSCSGHGRTRLLVTYRHACTVVDGFDDLNHALEQPVLLHDYSHISAVFGRRTLVHKP